jgi:hypothetical protein
MSRKKLLTSAAAGAVVSILAGTFCAMMACTDNAVVFIVCIMVCFAVAVLGWAIGLVQGDGMASQRYCDKAVECINRCKIQKWRELTRENISYNTALDTAAKAVQKEMGDR